VGSNLNSRIGSLGYSYLANCNPSLLFHFSKRAERGSRFLQDIINYFFNVNFIDYLLFFPGLW